MSSSRPSPRDQGTGPASTPSDSSRSKSSTQPPLPSIETPDPSIQQQRSSDATTSTPITTPQTSSTASLFRLPHSPRSGAATDSSQRTAKVAIPRLKRSIDASAEDTTRPGGRHRVTHACEPCRHRKTKCSGERPVCRHCVDFKIQCFYADGKRDRVKKCVLTSKSRVNVH